MSLQQDVNLTLCNFRERLTAESEKYDCGEAQVRLCCEQGWAVELCKA